jgi:sigma-B regulation protein RsbU (phosphoserine phosphatase)
MVHILIIDDDPVVQMVLTQSLQQQGYEVRTANNGEEGIRLIEDIHPELIICDWQMSGMSGLDVCRSVKAQPLSVSPFFILLTSRTAVEDRVQGLDTGADDFLSKPIDVSELKARVRAGLRLYQANQKSHQLAQTLQQQKQRLEAELAEAAGYIKSLLPSPLTGYVLADARFIPSQELGGDFFDYFWLNDNTLAFYILDVSGHGLGAALLSVSVQKLLRSQSLQNVNFQHPDEVLTALNNIYQTNAQQTRYFTIWYGVYTLSHRQLTYANAGHPPVVSISTASAPGTVQLLKGRGTPIGMLPDMLYKSEQCILEPQTLLYLYSDGLYEIRLSDGKRWTSKEFIELLSQHYQVEHCNLDAVLQAVEELREGDRFEDDCTLLQMRFH